MLTVLSVEYTTIFYERVKFQINIFTAPFLLQITLAKKHFVLSRQKINFSVK